MKKYKEKWTDADQAELLRLHALGLKREAIAIQLDRSSLGVKARLNQLKEKGVVPKKYANGAGHRAARSDEGRYARRMASKDINGPPIAEPSFVLRTDESLFAKAMAGQRYEDINLRRTR